MRAETNIDVQTMLMQYGMVEEHILKEYDFYSIWRMRGNPSLASRDFIRGIREGFLDGESTEFAPLPMNSDYFLNNRKHYFRYPCGSRRGDLHNMNTHPRWQQLIAFVNHVSNSRKVNFSSVVNDRLERNAVGIILSHIIKKADTFHAMINVMEMVSSVMSSCPHANCNTSDGAISEDDMEKIVIPVNVAYKVLIGIDWLQIDIIKVNKLVVMNGLKIDSFMSKLIFHVNDMTQALKVRLPHKYKAKQIFQNAVSILGDFAGLKELFTTNVLGNAPYSFINLPGHEDVGLYVPEFYRKKIELVTHIMTSYPEQFGIALGAYSTNGGELVTNLNQINLYEWKVPSDIVTTEYVNAESLSSMISMDEFRSFIERTKKSDVKVMWDFPYRYKTKFLKAFPTSEQKAPIDIVQNIMSKDQLYELGPLNIYIILNDNINVDALVQSLYTAPKWFSMYRGYTSVGFEFMLTLFSRVDVLTKQFDYFDLSLIRVISTE
jgi:nitrite reductase/ring-hydroxylating ferredoxin subunit